MIDLDSVPRWLLIVLVALCIAVIFMWPRDGGD